MTHELSREELLNALQNLPEPRYERQEDISPVRKPVDRYAQLPETTRQWLENLRPDDTKEIDDVRRWYRNTKIITTFGKWLVIALVGILLATGQVGEVIFKAISHVKGPP